MILVFDTETTGLPRFDLPADDPRQPRACALAAILADADGNEVEIIDHVIKPDGWEVPDEVARIHGLTTAICMERGVPVREVLDDFMRLHDLAVEIASYGIGFDLKILRGELRRAGLPDSYGAKPACDIIRAAAELCRIAPTNKMMAAGRKSNKLPKLSEAVEIVLGQSHETAHTALGDARMALRLMAKMPPDLRQRHTKQHVPAEKSAPTVAPIAPSAAATDLKPF